VGNINLQELVSEMEILLTRIDIELVDIEYRREREGQILRVYIDQESGVNLDTCTKASRAIKSVIDEKDLYYDHMEVSSPGLDRILKKEQDFIRHTGQMIKVKTSKEYDGPRKLTGILAGYDKNHITINTQDKAINIPLEQVSRVRLDPDK